MNDLSWINAALSAARPQAVGALLRYFRDLDRAEEAFQEAALRALKNWPQNGPPRDPAAWLIMVGRNAALDGVRKEARTVAMPDDDAISDLDDVETPLAERLVFRRPKEVLKLAASVGKPSFVPGEPVSLTVTATTEAGKPTPAIVWATVVSRSALSMGDDKAERTLPTHFLLGGEVQNPDDLEHADFLLTDQPGLVHMDRIPYESDMSVEFTTDNLLVKGYQRYSFNYNDWRAMYASFPTS